MYTPGKAKASSSGSRPSGSFINLPATPLSHASGSAGGRARAEGTSLDDVLVQFAARVGARAAAVAEVGPSVAAGGLGGAPPARPSAYAQGPASHHAAHRHAREAARKAAEAADCGLAGGGQGQAREWDASVVKRVPNREAQLRAAAAAARAELARSGTHAAALSGGNAAGGGMARLVAQQAALQRENVSLSGALREQGQQLARQREIIDALVQGQGAAPAASVLAPSSASAPATSVPAVALSECAWPPRGKAAYAAAAAVAATKLPDAAAAPSDLPVLPPREDKRRVWGLGGGEKARIPVAPMPKKRTAQASAIRAAARVSETTAKAAGAADAKRLAKEATALLRRIRAAGAPPTPEVLNEIAEMLARAHVRGGLAGLQAPVPAVPAPATGGKPPAAAASKPRRRAKRPEWNEEFFADRPPRPKQPRIAEKKPKAHREAHRSVPAREGYIAAGEGAWLAVLDQARDLLSQELAAAGESSGAALLLRPEDLAASASSGLEAEAARAAAIVAAGVPTPAGPPESPGASQMVIDSLSSVAPVAGVTAAPAAVAPTVAAVAVAGAGSSLPPTPRGGLELLGDASPRPGEAARGAAHDAAPPAPLVTAPSAAEVEAYRQTRAAQLASATVASAPAGATPAASVEPLLEAFEGARTAPARDGGVLSSAARSVGASMVAGAAHSPAPVAPGAPPSVPRLTTATLRGQRTTPLKAALVLTPGKAPAGASDGTGVAVFDPFGFEVHDATRERPAAAAPTAQAFAATTAVANAAVIEGAMGASDVDFVDAVASASAAGTSVTMSLPAPAPKAAQTAAPLVLPSAPAGLRTPQVGVASAMPQTPQQAAPLIDDELPPSMVEAALADVVAAAEYLNPAQRLLVAELLDKLDKVDALESEVADKWLREPRAGQLRGGESAASSSSHGRPFVVSATGGHQERQQDVREAEAAAAPALSAIEVAAIARARGDFVAWQAHGDLLLAGEEVGFDLVAAAEGAAEALLDDLLAELAVRELDRHCAELLDAMVANEFRAS